MSHPDRASGLSLELECTSKCRSQLHASELLAAVTRGDNAEIQAYCRWLCHNFFSVTDKLGRNVLHMAAACGKWRLIEWLIKCCHSEIDMKDRESGWTALHRSLFYGQIAAARKLLLLGASLRVHDYEGLTPLDIVMKDRLPYIEYTQYNPLEVYVWGSNANFNLGLGNEQSRSQPELLEIFRREDIGIKQVVMCKFHSVFLSNCGKVYTCGHGHGARLGQNSEQTVLTPASIKGLGSTVCQEIAAGQDHLVLLTESGQVWTCGLNTYHQLGHVPPPERLLIPRPLTLKLIKDQQFVGVCAARYHTVLYTKDAVFTCGLNAGQLGHPKGDKTQIAPRQVSSLDHKDWKITHVGVSDGATVCATSKGDVYVLHEYQCRKIASRQLEIQKLSVIGGHLDARCDAANVKEGGGFELRIIILTKSGKIFLWRDSYPQLRRCIFDIRRQLTIGDAQITHIGISLVTKDGNGFLGQLNFSKDNQHNSSENNVSSPNTKSSVMVSSLHTLLNKDECDLIRVKRLSVIHRAVKITSDSKGRNFAVLQSHPKIGLIDLPTLPVSKMQNDFGQLLQNSHADDIIHDVILNVGNRQFYAHKYILASRSEYFHKLFVTEESTDGVAQKISVDGIKPDIFEQVLQFIYTNECDFLKEGKEIKLNLKNNADISNDVNFEYSSNELCGLSAYKVAQEKSKKLSKQSKKTKKKVENPITDLRDTSKRMGIPILYKKMEAVKLIGGKIKIGESSSVPEKLQFNCKNLPHLCDVQLLSEDKKEFMCHRCILVARSEYFQSMLECGWIETASSKPLFLSIKSEILEIVLDYLYTDDKPKFYALEDPEFLCNTLVIADLLLIDRLKAMCEIALVEMITLRNVAELLELSYVYNASQLKATCMQYICINLPAVLENGSLNVVNDEAMEELTKFYHNLIPAMNKRIITPYSMGPTPEKMRNIAEQFPIDSEADLSCQYFDTNAEKEKTKSEGKGKGRRRVNSHRNSTDENKLSRKKSESENIEINVTLEKPCPNVVEENKHINNQSISDKTDSTKVVQVQSSWIPKKSGKSGWMKESEVIVPQLKEIMLEEQVSQNLTKKDVRMNNSGSRSLWKNLSQNSENNTVSLFPTLDKSDKSQSTKNQVKTHHWDVTNPWNKTPENDKPVPNLGDILRAEEQQQHEMQQLKAKPLHLIHLEDEAIEKLLKIYDAEDNPEERISVQRILPDKIATPVWKKRSSSLL